MLKSLIKGKDRINNKPLVYSPILLCLICALMLGACAPSPGHSANPAPSQVASVSQPESEEPLVPDNPVLEQIAASFSSRDFVEGAILAKDLQAILQSGAKAPSAKNAQPWHFTVISGAKNVQTLYERASEGAVIVAVSGKEKLATDTVEFDCGLAAAYMQLAAESLGYGARILISPVSALNKDRDAYAIPEGYTVLAAIVIGPIDQADAVSSATTRKPLSDMVNYVR